MARLGVGTVDKDQRGDITVQAQPTYLLEGERAVGVVADYGVDHRQATELFKPVGHVAQGRCRIPEFASPPRGHGELERGRDSGSGFAYALSGAPRKAQRLRAFVPCVVDVPVLDPLTCIDRVQQLRADSARAASASTKVGDGQVHFRRFVEEQDPEGDVGAFGEGPSPARSAAQRNIAGLTLTRFVISASPPEKSSHAARRLHYRRLTRVSLSIDLDGMARAPVPTTSQAKAPVIFAEGSAQLLVLLEEVLVDLVDIQVLQRLNCDAVVPHQGGEPDTVDEDHLPAVALSFLTGAAGECGGGDEDAAAGTFTAQGAEELLDGGPLHGVAVDVTLGLDVDLLQAEGVLIDDPVDSTVTAAADRTTTPVRPAVSHRFEQFDDGLFKELRGRLLQPSTQAGLHRVVELVDAATDPLQKTLPVFIAALGRRGGRTASRPGTAGPLRLACFMFSALGQFLLIGPPLRPLLQVTFAVDLEVTLGARTPVVGDPVEAPLWPLEQIGDGQTRARVADPEPQPVSAGSKGFLAHVLVEPYMVGDHGQ